MTGLKSSRRRQESWARTHVDAVGWISFTDTPDPWQHVIRLFAVLHYPKEQIGYNLLCKP